MSLSDRQRLIFGAGFVIMIVGVLVHFPSLVAPIYYDDEYIIRQNLWVFQIPKGTWYAQAYADHSHFFRIYRPTLIASYFFNLKLWNLLPFFQDDPFAALRLGTLFIHLSNAVLLFLLFMKISGERFSKYACLIAAIIFAVHPVQTLGISFIWKRSSVLCSFFLLLGLVHAVTARKHQRFSYSYVLDLGIQTLLCFLCVTSKEDGFLYPFYVLAIRHMYLKRTEGSGLEWQWWTWSILIYAWLCLIFSPQITGAIASVASSGQDNVVCSNGMWGYFRASMSVLPHYFRLMVFPEARILDEPVWVCTFFTFEFFVLLGLLALSIFVWVKEKSLECRFGIVLLWFGFAVTQTFHPLYLIMDQIRLYIPLMGLSLILAFVFSALWQNQKSLRVLIAILGMSYGALGWMQSFRYRNLETIWLDVADAYPKSFVAWDNLGAKYDADKKYAKAHYAYSQALKAKPDSLDFKVREILSRVRLRESKTQLQQEFLKLNLSDTTEAMTILHGAMLASELDLYEQAETLLQHFIQYYPDYALAHYILGDLFEKTQRYELAWRAYQNALSLDQGMFNARKRSDKLVKEGKVRVPPSGSH